MNDEPLRTSGEPLMQDGEEEAVSVLGDDETDNDKDNEEEMGGDDTSVDEEWNEDYGGEYEEEGYPEVEE